MKGNGRNVYDEKALTFALINWPHQSFCRISHWHSHFYPRALT